MLAVRPEPSPREADSVSSRRRLLQILTRIRSPSLSHYSLVAVSDRDNPGTTGSMPICRRGLQLQGIDDRGPWLPARATRAARALLKESGAPRLKADSGNKHVTNGTEVMQL